LLPSNTSSICSDMLMSSGSISSGGATSSKVEVVLMSSGSISSGGATSSKVEVVADADGMSGTEAAVAFATGAKGGATPTTFAAADGMFGPSPTTEGTEFAAGATKVLIHLQQKVLVLASDGTLDPTKA
jgi:hypothetical protein